MASPCGNMKPSGPTSTKDARLKKPPSAAAIPPAPSETSSHASIKTPSPDFFWPQLKKSEPRAKPPDPKQVRILALRKEQDLILYQIQEVLKRENMPVSVGYIQKVFSQENVKRQPCRSTQPPAPRTIPANRKKLDPTPRSFSTDFAGLFLFAFDLARMELDEMLDQVNMPGTRMIPPGCAVRSLLALKLSGVGRPSQVMAETLDQGLALFTGLNAIPKRTTLTEYSIQVDPTFAGSLMHRWYHAAAQLANVAGTGASVDLDFHTIPYHGHQALLQQHFLTSTGCNSPKAKRAPLPGV